MKYYQFFIDNINRSSEILDIGCGNGYVSYKIAEYAKKVVGIDINLNSINYAKKYYNRENIQYIVGDALNYKFDKKFDVIILSNFLEHINKRIEFLVKIKHLSDYILTRVPMINRSWLPLYKKSLGLEYRLDQTHYIEYTLKTFYNEIESAGFKIISYSIQFGEIWARIEKKNHKS
ncbi:MAG: class I SAM-dependent methyltransferase [Promethearchaeota archaeon]